MDNIEDIPAKDFTDLEQALIRHSQQGQKEFDLSAPGAIREEFGVGGLASLNTSDYSLFDADVTGTVNFLADTFKESTGDKDFEFTQGQAHALNDISQVFNLTSEGARKSPSYVLKGYAGTGKTTMVQALINMFDDHHAINGYGAKFVWTGYTNNVANMGQSVFDNSGLDSPSGKFISGTSSSLFRSGQKDNNVSGRLNEFLGEDKLPTYVFVDETSLYPERDIKKLVNFANKAHRDTEGNVKFIFLGDPGQLRSPYFNGSVNPLVNNYPSTTLTEITRQASGEILDFVTALRTLPENNKAPAFPVESKGQVQVYNGSQPAKAREFDENFYETFKNDPENTIALSYRNVDVVKNNALARRALLDISEADVPPGKLESILAENLINGERLNVLETPKNTDLRSIQGLANGSTFKVKNVRLQHGFDPKTKKSSFVLDGDTNLPASLYVVDVTDPKTNEIIQKDVPILLIPSSGKITKSDKKTTNYSRSNKNISVLPTAPKPVIDRINSKDYVVASFGYGVTLHRSQGLQYDNVFINGLSEEPRKSNIDGLYGGVDNNFRLLYVGASRATKKLHIQSPNLPKNRGFGVVPEKDAVLKNVKGRQLATRYGWTWKQIESRVRYTDDEAYRFKNRDPNDYTDLDDSNRNRDQGKDLSAPGGVPLGITPFSKPLSVDRSKPNSSVTYTDRLSYMSELFEFADPSDPRLSNFLNSFVDDYIIPMAEQGRFFKHTTSFNQFYKNPMGAIETSQKIMDLSFLDYDDGSLRRKVYRELKKGTDEKTKQLLLEDMERLRKGRILSLSLRNLAVSIMAPKFAQKSLPIASVSIMEDIPKLLDESIDEMNLQRADLRSHITGYLHRLQKQKRMQDYRNAMLFHIRVLLNAQLAGNNQPQTGSSVTTKQLAHWYGSQHNTISEALFTELKGRDPNLPPEENVAWFFDQLLDRNPNLPPLNLNDIKLPAQEAKNFQLTSGLAIGSDTYWSELANLFGLDISHFVDSSKKKYAFDKKPWAHGTVSAPDLKNKILSQAFNTANTFFARAFQSDKKWDNDGLVRRNFYQIFPEVAQKGRIDTKKKRQIIGAVPGFTKVSPEVSASMTNWQNGKQIKRIPKGGTGWAVFYAIDAYYQKVKNFRIQKPDISIWDESTEQWYMFDFSLGDFVVRDQIDYTPTIKEGRPVALIGTRGLYTDKESYDSSRVLKLRTKSAFEEVFIKSFPNQGNHLLNSQALRISINDDGSKFNVETSSGTDPLAIKIIQLKYALDQLDSLPYTFLDEEKTVDSDGYVAPRSNQLTVRNQLSTDEKVDPKNAVNNSFSGTTVQGGLPSKVSGMAWGTIIKSVKRANGTLNDNSVPTVIEIFKEFPEMPWSFKSALEADIAKIQNSSIAYEQKKIAEITSEMNSKGIKPANSKDFTKNGKMDMKAYYKANRPYENAMERVRGSKQRIRLYNFTIEQILENIRLADMAIEQFSDNKTLKKRLDKDLIADYLGRSNYTTPVYSAIMTKLNKAFISASNQMGASLSNRYPRSSGSDNTSTIDFEESQIDDQYKMLLRLTGMTSMIHSTEIEDAIRELEEGQENWGFTPSTDGQKDIESFGGLAGEGSGMPLEDAKASAKALNLERSSRDIKNLKKKGDLGAEIITKAIEKSTNPQDVQEYVEMLLERGVWYHVVPSTPRPDGKQLYQVQQIHKLWDLGKNADWIDSQYESWLGMSENQQSNYFKKLSKNKDLEKPFINWLKSHFTLRKKIRQTSGFDNQGAFDPKLGQNTLRPISLAEINKRFDASNKAIFNYSKTSNARHILALKLANKKSAEKIAKYLANKKPNPKNSVLKTIKPSFILREERRIATRESLIEKIQSQEKTPTKNPDFKYPPQYVNKPDYLAPTEDSIARFIEKVKLREEKDRLNSWMNIQALMTKGIPGGPDADRAFDLSLVRNVYFLFGEKKVKELLYYGLHDFRASRGHDQILIDTEANKNTRNTVSPDASRQATSRRAPGMDQLGRYDEAVARVKFFNWAFREELDAVGIEPRQYDEILDKKYYFDNIKADTLKWDPKVKNPIEEYFQATMALSNYLHSTDYISPAFLQELNLPDELLKTGYSKVGNIVDAIEAVLRDDAKNYDIGDKAQGIIQVTEQLRERLFKAKEALNESEADSRSGFYISPRLLANALWNAGDSVARQVYPDLKRDKRGELMKGFNEVGLSAFQDDKELANFISRDMAGLPMGMITDQIIGRPDLLEEMTGGENPTMSFDQFVQKYGDSKLLKKARAEVAKLRFKTKGSSSANTSNAILVNGGAFTERVRMNAIPASVYLDMMYSMLASNPKMFVQDVNSSDNRGARLNINNNFAQSSAGNLGMLNEMILASLIQTSTLDPKAMGYTMSPNDNITGSLVTTADLINQGKRTATTRTDALGKPGELIRIDGVRGVFRVTGVEEVTKAKSENPSFIKEWSNKEGWTEAYFRSRSADFIGKTQTTFEPLNNYWDIFKNKDGSWNNSLLQLGFILMYDRQGDSNLKDLNESEFRGSESADFQFLGAGGSTSVDPALVDIIVMKGQEAIDNDLKNPDVVNQRNTQEDVMDTNLDEMDLSAPGAVRKSFDKWVMQDLRTGDLQNRDRAREKFRANELDRRDVVGQIRHGFHKRMINSYYEVEEMVELMMLDLKKHNPNISQSDIDRLRVDQRIRTYNGKTGVALDNAKSTYEMPFMDKVAGINDPDPLKLVGDYWYARYAKTRNNNIYKKRVKSGIAVSNHYGTDYGSGMSNSQADQILFKINNHSDFKKIQDITKDFDKMNQDTLKVLVDGGVLPQRQYDSIVHDAVDENGNWVWAPLRGFEKDYAEDYPTGLDGIVDTVDSSVLEKGTGSGSGFAQTRGQYALAHAFGRTNMANSYEIWGNAFKAHSEAIVRANKNTETAQSLLSLLTEITNNKETYADWNNVFEIIDSRDPNFKDRFPSKIVPFLSSDSKFSRMGLPEYQTTQLKEVRANELDLDLNNEIFTVRVEGEPVYIRFKGEIGRNIVTSLKGSENAKLGPFLKTFRGISGFFSAVYTVWNVSFIFSNAIRDVISASLNLGSSESTRKVASKVLDMKSLFRNAQVMYRLSRERRVGGLTTGILNDSDKAFYRKVSKQLMKDRSSVSEADLNKLLRSVEMTSLLFQDAGGQIEFYGMEDVETKTQDIFNNIAKLQKGTKVKQDENLIKSFVSLINDINTGVENATRVQAFKVLLQEGATVQESAFKGGREGTVDFTRKGTWTNYFNAFFPFFGAGIAGNARMIRSLFYGSEGESKSAKMRLAQGIVGFGFMYSLLARAYAGEDEETEEQHWDRLSDFQKSHNLNVFTKPGGVGDHFSVPLPYGWNILYGLGSRFADVAMSSAGKTDREYGVMEASAGVASMFIDTLHPMSGGHGITRFIPHLPRGFVEIHDEKNFLGNPIMPGQSPYGAEKPDSQRYWRTANPISKDLTQSVNRVTGGDDYIPGLIDVSPESIDHAINYYTGTMGRNLWSMAGMAYDSSATTDVQKFKQLPILPRLFKLETDDYSTEGRFIDLQKTVKSRTNRIKKLEARGDRAEASKFKRLDSSYVGIDKMLSRYQSRLSFTSRKLAELRKRKVDPVKLQQLESKFKSARIKDMSQILKKARQLGIST